ncbi:MAG: hypothetical protein AUI14_05235 [Actinobacteria bacterium 13_2_20CM_2_71_6]|nr:MAG: hypothetical protein AUI14_05235 [Actinobacteria bacterium 13_2_20CM_2_71_6]
MASSTAVSPEPALAPRFEAVDEATREVADLWNAPDSSGAVAHTAGRVAGFLLGTRKPDDTWGPNVWVEAAGHAAQDAETVRDLYAVAAARWVEDGRTAHYAVVPSNDAAVVDAWFRLGFGQQQVHALRPAETPGSRPIDGYSIRPAVADDVAALAPLDLALPEHQRQSPVFSAGYLPTLAEARDDWVETIDDPDTAAFVAEVRGAIVGVATGCPVQKSRMHAGLARPDDAGLLAFAVVYPDARGAGHRRRARPGGTHVDRRGRLPHGGHRLARHQPAVLADLAPAGLPRHVPAPAPGRGPLSGTPG